MLCFCFCSFETTGGQSRCAVGLIFRAKTIGGRKRNLDPFDYFKWTHSTDEGMAVVTQLLFFLDAIDRTQPT